MPKAKSKLSNLENLTSKTFEVTSPHLTKLLNETYFCLGKLDGLLAGSANLEILLAPLVVMEAVKSSNVESINSTVLDQLEVSVKGRKAISPEQKLTQNYKDALLLGFEYINKHQRFDLELILLIQKTLLPVDSGIRNLQPVVIANTATGDILYKPPLGKNVILSYLKNWLEQANNQDSIDILIKAAILHCQFEAIHPFIDGNGRTGRILIILFLIYKKVLSYPCLFISDYILKTRTYYYLALQDGQKDGNFSSIVEYLTRAILEKTQFSLNLIEQKNILERHFDEQIRELLSEIYSPELVQYLFINPFYSMASIQDYLKISRNTASKYLHLLTEKGMIQEQNLRKNKLFYNPAFLKLLA
jgi:Fic family protein